MHGFASSHLSGLCKVVDKNKIIGQQADNTELRGKKEFNIVG